MESAHTSEIKGVILAGGMGTRLLPLTKITNKHLLPVYNKPMILYPIDTLRRAGITEIVIVTGREHAGHFMNFLGSGKDYGMSFSYAIQDKNNGGIADALRYAEPLCSGSNLAVVLGDNIFFDDFSSAVRRFKSGAMVFIKKVKDPKRYGVPVFDRKGSIVRVEEKPKRPRSSFAQVGFYLFDHDVFRRISTVKPSPRGELEITDVINTYIDEGKVAHHQLKKEWLDAGTMDSLLDAATLIKKKSRTLR